MTPIILDPETVALMVHAARDGGSASRAVLGVCCHCQNTHPVAQNLERDTISCMFLHDEADDYLMARHRTEGDTGPWCEGEGTTPQALVKQR